MGIPKEEERNLGILSNRGWEIFPTLATGVKPKFQKAQRTLNG